MKTFLRIVPLGAALALASPVMAAPGPRAFEAPPTLPGQGGVVQLEAAPTPGGCRPQGSIARNGSIVSVILNLMLADFTINNPDPADPYK